MTTARNKKFCDLQIGDTAIFERTITHDDITTFIKLSGDTNPLHHNINYASKTKFKKPIVHGMLLGSLCSTLVGVYLPGKRCLYLGQNLLFKQPVFAEETVSVRGTITFMSTVTRLIEIEIEIKEKDELVVCGTAKVQILD